MKETFGNAIWIFVVIDMLVVRAVVACPEERRVFKCGCPEDEGEKTYAPVSLECQVRVKSVVSDSDRKSAGTEHNEEEHYLERIDAKEIEVGRHRGEREKQGTDEKRAGRPVDFIERDSREHGVVECLESTGTGQSVTSRHARELFPSGAVKLCNN